MCEAHRALYVRYIRTHHYLLLLLDHKRRGGFGLYL